MLSASSELHAFLVSTLLWTALHGRFLRSGCMIMYGSEHKYTALLYACWQEVPTACIILSHTTVIFLLMHLFATNLLRQFAYPFMLRWG